MKSERAPCKVQVVLILGEELARYYGHGSGENVGWITCGIHTLLRDCKAIDGWWSPARPWRTRDPLLYKPLWEWSQTGISLTYSKYWLSIQTELLHISSLYRWIGHILNCSSRSVLLSEGGWITLWLFLGCSELVFLCLIWCCFHSILLISSGLRAETAMPTFWSYVSCWFCAMGHLFFCLCYLCRQLFWCLNCYREAWSCLRTWWILTWLSRESVNIPSHSNRDWNSSLGQEIHKMFYSHHSHYWSASTSTPQFKSWTRNQCFQGFWSCSWIQSLLSLRTSDT